jgi:hypothetical protein
MGCEIERAHLRQRKKVAGTIRRMRLKTNNKTVSKKQAGHVAANSPDARSQLSMRSANTIFIAKAQHVMKMTVKKNSK